MRKPILQKTDCQNPQKENPIAEMTVSMVQAHLQQQYETYDTIRNLQPRQSPEYRSSIGQLRRIFEVLQDELKDYQGDLPTSFARVETELAKCISGCLVDVRPQRRDIDYIRSLLRDQQVIVPLRCGKPSVSLHKVHLILQDNYKDSYLCELFNILIAGFMGVETKVINFF